MNSESESTPFSSPTFNVPNSNVYTTSNADTQSYIRQYFVPLNLSHLEREGFLIPQITTHIVNRVIETHLLILASPPSVRVDHLLIHVAWGLREVLQHRGSCAEGLLFLECNTNLDLAKFDLAAELEKIGKPAIIIIPSASPQHLGWDLVSVHKAATSASHFIICSTVVGAEKWYLNEADGRYWYNLSIDSVYDARYLVDFFTKQLLVNQNALPKNLREIIDPDKAFLGQLTIRKLAKLLLTDTNIAAFIQLLCQSQQVNVDDIRELIHLARQSDNGVIKKWFLSLPPREQLMALAISFFDGLLEEQVFAALQELVTSVWKQSSTLELFDYLEVERIRIFFPVNNELANRPRFDSRSSEHREILLKLAWDKYRIHIRVALPWLVQLVKNSMKQDARFKEIYGGDKQREQLRSSISETLSDVGLLSAPAVQDALLWLVADKFPPVQVVAARTMAKWYKAGHTEIFYLVLSEWHETRRAKAFVETALKQQYGGEKHDVIEYTEPATVLAISYAAKNDRPNHISTRLIEMLEKYISNPSEKVVNCLKNYTIPMLLPTHLVQMKNLTQKMLLNAELHNSLAEVFLKLYNQDKSGVFNILQHWRDNALNESIITSNKLRDKTLPFVIRTFAAIWHIEPSSHPNSVASLDELYFTAQNANTRLVRASVADALFARIVRDPARFSEIKNLLILVISEMSEQELLDVAQKLSHHYLTERVEMKGGDDVFTNEHEKATYDTWIETYRRPTISEIIYYTWLTENYPRKVQLLALYTLIEIVQRFELPEEKYRKKILTKRKKALQQKAALHNNTSYDASLWFHRFFDAWFDKLMFWLATLLLKYYKAFIKRVLPEMNRQYQNEPGAVFYLLNKWHRVKEVSSMSLYASDMQFALKVLGKRSLVAIILAIILLVIIVAVIALYLYAMV